MNNLVGLVGVIPPLLAFVGRFIFDGRDSAALGRMARYAELLDKLPGEAKPPLELLIRSEVDSFASHRRRRNERSIDGGTVGALLLVGMVTAGLTWLGVSFALDHWLVWIPTGFVSLLGVALMAVGSGQVFKYPPEADGATKPTIEEPAIVDG